MKTLFFFHHQNLLLDAGAIFQNPVLLSLIFMVAIYFSFQAAKAYERYNRYRSINNLFDNIGGGYQQGPTLKNTPTSADIRPRKKGMPGFTLSLVVILSGIVAVQHLQQTPNDRQVIQASYHETNKAASDRSTTQVKANETYVNQSPSNVANKRTIEEHEYKPEQDFIPRSEKNTQETPEDYKVQHASMYSIATPTINVTSTSNTPIFTIQLTSASDHHQVRVKAYDYSKEFPRTDVFTYQQGGITKLFIGQYYSEQEMRSALAEFKKTISRGAFPVAMNSIDPQLLQTTY